MNMGDEPVEGARAWVRIDEGAPFARDRGAEVAHGEVLDVFAREDLGEQIVCPLNVLLRGHSVPLKVKGLE